MAGPADPRSFDVIVIGGGVNGTGIARDCAMRGLDTLLLEKRDFAAGSSGANSGMIHGGIRYLEKDPQLTKLSCMDSGYIQRIAPHLLFRIPFIYPLRSSGRPLRDWALHYGSEVYFEAYDRYQPLKRGKEHTRLTPDEAWDLEPGLIREIDGAITMDEWGIDPFRLCTLNARSAAAHGATVLNRTEVLRFLRADGGAVVGVEARDLRGGARTEYRAAVTFNAGGPWAPRIAALAGVTVRIRPGKGVHLTLDRRLSNYGVITEAVDGRQIFVMPHENNTIIGTTDDDYYGDPDDLQVSEDEVAYLLEGAAHAFPAVREARLLRTWAGVRPTLYAYGKTEDALSREHAIYDHAQDGAPGFMTMVGGKLATFRIMAEEATDAIARKVGRAVRDCRTHVEALPGGEASASPVELAREHEVLPFAASRLVYRHGAEAAEVLKLCDDEPALRAQVCPCEGVLGAELVYALRREMATGLCDLRRRCRLAMGPCQGARCLGPAAAIVATEKRLSPEETRGELLELMAERWKGERPVLSGDGLAEAELKRATYFGLGNLDVAAAPPRAGPLPENGGY
jgi:glycerol-3-phosphate dehydrogenase